MTELLGSGFTDTFRYFIQMPRVYIPGGHTVLRLARRTQAGVSTTLSHQSASMISCKRQQSIPMCSVQTTALLRLILNFKFKVMYFTIPYATLSSQAYPHPVYTQQHCTHRFCMQTSHCHPDNARSCPCPDMSVC